MSADDPRPDAPDGADPTGYALFFTTYGGGTTAIRFRPELFVIDYPVEHTAREMLRKLRYKLTPTEDALLARFEAADIGADFWRDVDAAGLAFPPPALTLATITRAVGLPLDLARGPVFSPRVDRGEDMQLALSSPTVVGSLHYKPFSIQAPAGWLTVRDGLLLAELVKMYIDQGEPESRAVAVTVAQICEAAGYPGKGGWQFARVSDALMRLRSATLRNVVRLEDGRQEDYVWGMVDAGYMRSGEDGGAGQVRLSEELVGLIRHGLLAHYDRATLHALVDADTYAARLWMFLEGECLDETPRRYSIFSAPRGAPPAERDTPAIADLLNLQEKHRTGDAAGWAGWGRRRDIVRRIRTAAAVLHDHDPRYTVTVEQAKSHPSMKNLCASRRRVPSVAPPVDDSPAPSVDNSGEGCTRSRAPRVRPVALGCTPSRAPSDESPARHERGEFAPSVLPSGSTVSQDLKNMTRLHQVEDEEPENQSREERPPACTTDALVAHLDPLADLAAIVGDDLVAALALTVCRQFRAASGGAICGQLGEQLTSDGEPYCEACHGMRGVGIKTLNYLTKKGHVDNPRGYVVNAMKRAVPDSPNLMGRTLAESKDALARMRALAPSADGD